MPSLKFRLALALALPLACDTGFGIDATIVVPADVAAAYTKESPGLLVVAFAPEGQGSNHRPVAVICGEAFTSRVLELGGDGERPDSTITAWIEPTPAGRPCGQLADTSPDEDEHTLDDDAPWARTTVEAAEGCERDAPSVSLTVATP